MSEFLTLVLLKVYELEYIPNMNPFCHIVQHAKDPDIL